MAFVQDDPNSPQNLLNPQPNQVNPAPQTSSGMGSGSGTAGSPQGVSSVPTSSKAPPVANLGDYLRANVPQATDMANKIADNLTSGLNTVQGDLTAGQGAFEDAVKSGTVAPNPDVVARAAANPAEFVKNPNDVAAFQKQRDAAYTGPQDFTTSDVYSQLSGEVQKAAGNAPNPNNPDDLRSTVAGIETNPTPGMTALDTMLLQGTPGAAPIVNAARAPYGSLKQTLQDLLTKENVNASTARATTATAPAAAVAPFTGPGGVVPTFTQGLTDRLAQMQQGTDAYNQEAQAYVQMLNDLQGHLAPMESAPFVQSPLNWTPPTVNPVTGAPTLSNTATSGDYATQAALEMLLGQGFVNPPLIDANASQAGTFSLPTATPPTMQDLIASASTPLNKMVSDAFAASNGAGWNSSTYGLNKAYDDLLSYLHQYAPDLYQAPSPLPPAP